MASCLFDSTKGGLGFFNTARICTDSWERMKRVSLHKAWEVVFCSLIWIQGETTLPTMLNQINVTWTGVPRWVLFYKEVNQMLRCFWKPKLCLLVPLNVRTCFIWGISTVFVEAAFFYCRNIKNQQETIPLHPSKTDPGTSFSLETDFVTDSAHSLATTL